MNLLEDLEFRGLLYQVTDGEGLAQRLQEGPITLYNGFDPTADSLTIGNLVTILLLRRFQLAGHKPIALAGGGTGLIGDPGGKTEERQLNAADTVAEWAEKIKAQLEPFLDFSPGPYAAEMVNNYDWLGAVKAIDFMRDVGKHFSVPYMLAKESVSSRLETGISYTEFSYMVLQAFDFLQLYQSHGCQLQTGGSDQWGNITAGTDLIRRSVGGKAFGLTCPLVTKADGTKFGKTEAGTIWLDPNRTSPYQFYQFWINAEDAKVVYYLKIFCFLEREEIEALEAATRDEPHKREAQRRLAQDVTRLVHGMEATGKAEKISRALFSGELRDLEEDEIEQGFGDVPSFKLEDGERGLIDLLVEAGVSPSKRQARQDIQSGAVYLNGERCQDLQHQVRKSEGLHGKYVVIRRGKNKYFLVD
ncbi:MAG: tyrosine--tRNA ligase [Candidatus Latescibacteria bacterium]|nr:tyrosine--tRNA ligase [Candidatus Latescibacterota bacterium]